MISHAPIDVCARCAYTTVQAAVAAAVPGSVIEVHDRQTGPLVIRVPLTLDGGNNEFAANGKGGSGIEIRGRNVTLRNAIVRGFGGGDDSGRTAGVVVASAHARIRNLTFVDDAFGFSAIGASDVTLEDVRFRSSDAAGDPIRIWHSAGVRIENADVSGGRDVFISWSPGVVVRHSRFTHLRYGLHDMFSPNLVVDGNTFDGCEIGTNFMYAQNLRVTSNRFARSVGPTGYGIGLEDTDDALFRGNSFVANHVAMHVVDSPARPDASLEIRDNVFAANGAALALQSDARSIVVAGNAFVGNVEQVQVSGGPSASAVVWNTREGGNYWSDYAGFAWDGSATGALPYRPNSTFEEVLDANPDLQVFRMSPVATAIDFATRSLVAQPPPKLVDARPLMTRPARRYAKGAPPLDARNRTTNGVLLASASAVPLVMAFASVLVPRRNRRTIAERTARAAHAIAVEGVTKRYGRERGIRDVSLTVARGESVALWGPNGAGKTTLLRCILGQTRYLGEIAIDGCLRVAGDVDTKRFIGYAPQQLPNFEMPIARFVRMLAELRAADMALVRAAFAEFGLDVDDSRSIGELSGGLRQRLGVACALIGDPPLLVLDEPTAGLDRASRHELLSLLARLKARGKTIVFTSHLVTDVRALADRVVVIEEGRIAADQHTDAFMEAAS